MRSSSRAANHLNQICVGQEWTFGANRSGSIRLLEELAPKLGFQVASVPPVLVDERVVSSTLIRSAVECGDLESAAKYLGRDFTILGTVTEGRQLGRRLGFPTANLRAHNELFPPNGVYAAKAWFREPSMAAWSISVFAPRSKSRPAKESSNSTYSISTSKSMAKTSKLLFWNIFDRNRSFPESMNSKLKFSVTPRWRVDSTIRLKKKDKPQDFNDYTRGKDGRARQDGRARLRRSRGTGADCSLGYVPSATFFALRNLCNFARRLVYDRKYVTRKFARV